MATLTIRNVDDEVKAWIREKAARHGISMEEEVRRILKRAVANKEKPQKDIVTQIREKFVEKGFKGIEEGELEIPSRNEYVTESPVDFSTHFDEGEATESVLAEPMK